MLRTLSFLLRLSAELPGPVSALAALLMPPWPEPRFAARLPAPLAVLVVDVVLSWVLHLPAQQVRKRTIGASGCIPSG